MQNKANFKKDRMNVNYCLQKDCENEQRRRLWENKPNFQKTEDGGQKTKNRGLRTETKT